MPAARRILLVFAKAPEPGRVKTRLAATLGTEEAARIYRQLGRTVVDAIRGGAFRLIVYFDPPEARAAMGDWLGEEGVEFRAQPPGDLGRRLAEGFAWGFLEGDLVCAVGTDVPKLDLGGVESAFEVLATPDGAEVVFGPATDGGYYLIGMRRPAPALFEGIPWSTAQVMDASLARARALGLDVHLLPPLADVDRPEDIPEDLFPAPTPTSMTPPNPQPSRRTRVRCNQVEVDFTPDSRCRVRVELGWVDGASFEGEGRGNATPQGRVNAGALATLQAVERVSGNTLELELRGTKVVRAFDSLLVIIALRARIGDRRIDLIGSTVAPDDDLVRGAVLSFLDATNRAIEPYAPDFDPSVR